MTVRVPDKEIHVASSNRSGTGLHSTLGPDGLAITMSEECANPLLLGWIKEWLDQARERNSKGVTVSVSTVYLAQQVDPNLI